MYQRKKTGTSVFVNKNRLLPGVPDVNFLKINPAA